MKITLCGSTKFIDLFHEWNRKLALAGHVVYSLSVYDRSLHDKQDDPRDPSKRLLDLVHLAKIEESDAVAVLNKGGYIGDSTWREIAWARIRGKQAYYLEAPRTPYGLGEKSMLTLIAEESCVGRLGPLPRRTEQTS